MAPRGGALTITMLGIATLSGVLGLEAARTARGHRAATERVLRDYAALGAEGVATRLQAQLAGRFFPVVNRLGEALVPSRSDLAAGLGSGAAELARSVSWVAWLDASGAVSSIRYHSPPLPPADLAPLIRQAAASLPEAAYFGLVALGEQFIVFAPPRSGSPRSAAFGLPRDTLSALLGRAITQDAVLPGSLTRGEPLGDLVSVTILLDDAVLARRGSTDSLGFAATHSLGPVFRGMAVHVALARSLAPRLVIGGLPRSRLPSLITVVGLTLALAATGMIQLRREARLARLREDFVAGASHELRTPLAQIRLFAETLRLNRVRDEAERDRALVVVEREARRLEHLVENLLHFSRAERGAQRVAPESVDLGALTREIVADFAPLAEKAGVRIRVAGAGSMTALVDPAAWRQVVLNLLDNAAKYGGQGTEVLLELSAGAAGLELTVADQGPGVAGRDRERIWNRFWRGDGARQAGIAGTGIGLSTVRDLVELHGGHCRVEPNVPRGARFVVRLPGTG